jgi:DNA-binding PadR family transcriptional regulator
MHGRMHEMRGHRPGLRGRGFEFDDGVSGRERGRGGGPRRRARRGAVRGNILRLLRDRPMYGYELIAEFEERSGGRWRPSAGSIYPTLTMLEEEGLITGAEDEGRRRFTLTDAGLTWLDEHQHDEHLGFGPGSLGRRGDLMRYVGEIGGQLRQIAMFGNEAQMERAKEILATARKSLYAVLADSSDPDDTPADDTGAM